MLTKEEYAANRKKWVEALRSGEYEQGKEFLQCGSSFCCLGIACEVASKNGVPVSMSDGEIDGVCSVSYTHLTLPTKA